MNVDLPRRLERLNDDLEEHMAFQPAAFGIISTDTNLSSKEPESWRFLTQRTRPKFAVGKGFSSKHHLFDPFAKGTRCIWWYGDGGAISKLKTWINRLRALLEGHAGLLPGMDSAPGYYGVLDAIVALALSQPDLSDAVCERTLIDLKQVPESERSHYAKRLWRQEVSPTFIIQEPRVSVKHLVDSVIGHFLRSPRITPRLTIDAISQTVRLDGQTLQLPDEEFRVVELLVNEGGRQLTRKQMQKRDSVLELVERVDRVIAKVRKRYKEYDGLIKSNKYHPPGYWIDEEYLK